MTQLPNSLNLAQKDGKKRGTWMVQSVQHLILDLRAMSSRLTLGLKKKEKKKMEKRNPIHNVEL